MRPKLKLFQLHDGFVGQNHHMLTQNPARLFSLIYLFKSFVVVASSPFLGYKPSPLFPSCRVSASTNFTTIPAMMTLQAAPPSIRVPNLRLIRCDLKPPGKLPSSFTSSLLLSDHHHHQQHSVVLNPPANQSVAAVLLEDGFEMKLWPLTRRRSAGAIPIAAKYRLVDAVVSNCINSNITKIYALTQFNSTSLNSHLSKAYTNVGLGKDGFVEVIAAYQSLDNKGWFQGNADAVRRCLWMLEDYPLKEFLILPGHHLYTMDYQKLVQSHRIYNADVTISAISSIKNQDRGFGILQVNSENQVLQLRRETDTRTRFPGGLSEDLPYSNFASMGIYVVNKDVLIKILRDYFPGANDFRTEVIPGIISLGMKDRFCARIRFMHIHKKDIGRTWGASEHSMKPTWKAQGEETWDISR